MSTTRGHTFGELRTVLMLLKEERQPQHNMTHVEHLEEAITDVELTRLLADHGDEEVISAEFYATIRDYLAERWERIKACNYLHYQNNTASHANKACIALADFAKSGLADTNLIQLLIPEIESPESFITSTNLGDGETAITDIILSDDHHHFIEPRLCIDLAQEEGVLCHTQKLDGAHKPVELSDDEKMRVIEHSDEMRAYHEAIQKRVEFTHAKSNLGACLKLLIEGLRGGGAHGGRGGQEYNAGGAANEAIVAFALIYDNLPADMKAKLNSMQAGHGYEYATYTFLRYWEVLTVGQQEKIAAINSNRHISRSERERQLQAIHEDSSTCVEITAGNLDGVLRHNTTELYAMTVDAKANVESIGRFDATVKAAETRVIAKLKMLANISTHQACWMENRNTKDQRASLVAYLNQWLANANMNLEDFKATMEGLIARNVRQFSSILIDDMLDRMNPEQRAWCINSHFELFHPILSAKVLRQIGEYNSGNLNWNDLFLQIARKNKSERDILRQRLSLLLMRDDVDCNYADPVNQCTALMYVCESGNVQFLNILLAQPNINLNAVDSNGNTAMIRAIRNGHMNIVQALISAGADTTILNATNSSALAEAASANRFDIFDLLLTQPNQNINQINSDGHSMLENAIFKGLYDTATRLIELHANITNPQHPARNALLFATSKNAPIHFLQTLINTGISINAQDDDGNTPLIHAAQQGNNELFKALIAKGADATIQNRAGRTALAEAVHAGRHEILKDYITGNTANLQEVMDLCIAVENGGAAMKTLFQSSANEIHNWLKTVEMDQFVVVMTFVAEETSLSASELFTKLIVRNMNDVQLGWLVNEHHDFLTNRSNYNWLNSLVDLAGEKLTEANTLPTLDRIRVSLLKSDLDINSGHSDTSRTALIAATIGGSRPVVDALLSAANINIDATDSSGYTALMHAFKTNHNEISHLLIERGADINITNANGYTPLIMAANAGNLDVVLQLLAISQSNIDIRDNEGNTALIHAVIHNREDIVGHLLEKGADINIANNSRRNALMIAAECGRIALSKLLLNHEIENINERDDKGETAIYKAIRNGSAAITQALIDKGADITIPDNDGNLALDMAIAKKDIELMNILMPTDADELQRLFEIHIMQPQPDIILLQYLIRRGVNVNTALGNDETPLMLAVRTKSNDLTRILLAAGADAQATLVTFVTQGHVESIRHLISNSSASVNATFGPAQQSLLMHAAENQDIPTIKCLVELHANTEYRNAHGQTVLRKAAAAGHTDVVEALLEKQAQKRNIDSTDAQGNSALMIAARHGRLETVTALLNHGAKVNTTNLRKSSALAEAAQHPDVALLLAKKMIETYRDQRNLGGRWTRSFFGCWKETKIGAANAVIAMIESTPENTSYADHLRANMAVLNKHHKRALNQGDLGKLFGEILAAVPAGLGHPRGSVFVV